MPRRKVVLTTGEIYHVYNRTIAKQDVFSSKIGLRKAFQIIEYYRYSQSLRLSRFKTLTDETKDAYMQSVHAKPPLVEIYTFAFMPNHYHFLLKQNTKKGIGNFISNFQNSFAKIFNLKNERTGALFQNQFKAKRIETDEEFEHVSRYIHLNPVTAFLIEPKDLAQHLWTSLSIYTESVDVGFVETSMLLDLLGSKEKLLKFVEDQVGYQRTLDQIKHLTLE